MKITTELLRCYGFRKQLICEQTETQLSHVERWMFKDIVVVVDTKENKFTFYLADKGCLATGILLWDEQHLKSILKDLETSKTVAAVYKSINKQNVNVPLTPHALQQAFRYQLN